MRRIGSVENLPAAATESPPNSVKVEWARHFVPSTEISKPMWSSNCRSHPCYARRGFCERFTREVRSLVHLSHPHVVKVIDVGNQDGLPFALMQFLPGGSLDERRPLDVNRRYSGMVLTSLGGWLPSISEAIDFVHRSGYVHRDVKPDNILFDQHGHAYLSDFGVARVISQGKDPTSPNTLTMTGTVMGTPRYMAPELIMGEAYDGRVDLYALAVTLHEVLAGAPPIDAPTITALLVQQTTQLPPRLHSIRNDIPESLSYAVLRALAKDPASRYPSCASFAADVLHSICNLAEYVAEPVLKAKPSRVYGHPPQVLPEKSIARRAKLEFTLPLPPQVPYQPAPVVARNYWYQSNWIV